MFTTNRDKLNKYHNLFIEKSKNILNVDKHIHKIKELNDQLKNDWNKHNETMTDIMNKFDQEVDLDDLDDIPDLDIDYSM